MTTEQEMALTELDNLLRLLEAQLPGNLESPANQKLVRSLERDMASYFRQLEMAIDFTALEALYYKRVKQE